MCVASRRRQYVRTGTFHGVSSSSQLLERMLTVSPPIITGTHPALYAPGESAGVDDVFRSPSTYIGRLVTMDRPLGRIASDSTAAFITRTPLTVALRCVPEVAK